MTAWYRNEDWSDAIAADFERRLARSRHQKAQNLSLQGYHLIPRRPAIACQLLTRAVEIGDDSEAPRALGFLATAHLALGEVDSALDAYERAMKLQIANPTIIAVQPADYLFVVGIFGRLDRLAVAEPIADTLLDEGPFGPDAQVFAGKALVYDLCGRTDDARRYAARALPMMKDLPHVAALGVDIGNLHRKLQDLSGP